MKKLASLLGGTVAGYAGWYIGAMASTTTAFIVMMVATGFGMYYGVKLARRYLE